MPSKGFDGQGMVEYGLIIALVAIIALGALGLYGNGVGDSLIRSANTVREAMQ